MDVEAALDATRELAEVVLDITRELAGGALPGGEGAAEVPLLPDEPEEPDELDDEPPPIPFTAAHVPEKPMPGVAAVFGVFVTSGPGSENWTS
jgi:hypothetical protein